MNVTDFTITIADICLDGIRTHEDGGMQYWYAIVHGADWVEVACQALPDRAELIRAIVALNDASTNLDGDMRPLHAVLAMAGPGADTDEIDRLVDNVYRCVATFAGLDGMIWSELERTRRLGDDAHYELTIVLDELVDAVVLSHA